MGTSGTTEVVAMKILKKFFAGRGVGYYLTPFAVVCGIVAYILYANNGITSFNPSLNSGAVGCAWAGAALCAVTLVLDFKEIKYAAAMVYLYGFMCFLYSQITYIANVFVAIDGYGFTAGFIGTFITFLLSFVLALLAGIFTRWRPWANKKTAVTEEVR